MITIKNLKTEKLKQGDVRVDRMSVLGNPFIMKNESHRDSVCDQYEEYFKQQFQDNPNFRKELKRIISSYKHNGYINLFCWCSPKRCHAETIKNYILKTMNESGGN